MAGRKASMTEKRKRRQAKSQREENTFANLPKPNFQSAPETSSEPQQMTDPAEAAQKAQKLLQAQRASVNMLTMVREGIDALPAEDMLSALDITGHYVVDDFLGNHGANSVNHQLEQEANSLLQGGAMEADVSNFGSGEYVLAITGGKEQYTKCARSVELVVSTTKHVPAVLKSLTLNPAACQATLRTFDRKAFQASLALLTGSEEVPEIERPFDKVVTEDDDKRSLTLYYYVLPESWDESCGGGLVFEKGGKVSAKRDRLVVWKSDSCLFKTEAWRGSDDNAIGSCIELHLVKKSK
jgi:hypothetical protein